METRRKNMKVEIRFHSNCSEWDEYLDPEKFESDKMAAINALSTIERMENLDESAKEVYRKFVKKLEGR